MVTAAESHDLGGQRTQRLLVEPACGHGGYVFRDGTVSDVRTKIAAFLEPLA
jgi:hypothetical protein